MKTTAEVSSGFTLIELIIVIAIIGILSVIALPKFINLSSSSQTSATAAIAGSLASASATNYAIRKVSSSLGTAITNCTGVANALQGSSLPANYTITSAAIAVDASTSCVLNGPNSTSATFTAIGIT